MPLNWEMESSMFLGKQLTGDDIIHGWGLPSTQNRNEVKDGFLTNFNPLTHFSKFIECIGEHEWQCFKRHAKAGWEVELQILQNKRVKMRGIIIT